jgi:uncharacterized protein
MGFEWDDAKSESTEWKHGVSFTEAMMVCADPLSFTGYDPHHADLEDGSLTMGISLDGWLLVVRTRIAARWSASSVPERGDPACASG